MNLTRLGGEGEWCNTYIVGEEGKECLIVDFGDNKNHKIENYVKRHHSACLGVLLTHGHFDHIWGFSEAEHPFPYDVYLGAEDIRCLEDPSFNCSYGFGLPPLQIEGLSPKALYGGETLNLGNFEIEVIATPFHTSGSLCYYLKKEKILFSGDTLFRYGVGRDDLRGSCPRKKADSLAKLGVLDPETKVYPGHGGTTKIGEEIGISLFK